MQHTNSANISATTKQAGNPTETPDSENPAALDVIIQQQQIKIKELLAQPVRIPYKYIEYRIGILCHIT